jgi:hypothetical protein
MNDATRALVSGAVGAGALTALHETVRRVAPHAPRMDVIGERALKRSLRKVGITPPKRDGLYRWTLAGDLTGNALYYGLVGIGDDRRAWLRGAALGLAAGLGAAFLPGPLGLGRQPGQRTPMTQILTVAWYLAGGLAAAAVYRALSRPAAPETAPIASPLAAQETGQAPA